MTFSIQADGDDIRAVAVMILCWWKNKSGLDGVSRASACQILSSFQRLSPNSTSTLESFTVLNQIIISLWDSHNIFFFGSVRNLFYAIGMCTCMLCLFSHVQLFPAPWTVTIRSSVHGILQTRILEWVAMPSPRGSPQTRDQTHVFCISRQFLYHSTTWEAHFTIFYASKVMLKILQARLQQYVNVNF